MDGPPASRRRRFMAPGTLLGKVITMARKPKESKAEESRAGRKGGRDESKAEHEKAGRAAEKKVAAKKKAGASKK